MKTKGFFWHIHHEVLCEWSDDIQERIRCIETEKPKEERELRLMLMKPVKGKLPDKFVRAGKAYVKAREACVLVSFKAREAYDKAREAYFKALKAYDKAREDCKDEIEVLHRKECPDCPWDGKSIFSGEVY